MRAHSTRVFDRSQYELCIDRSTTDCITKVRQGCRLCFIVVVTYFNDSLNRKSVFLLVYREFLLSVSDLALNDLNFLFHPYVCVYVLSLIDI